MRLLTKIVLSTLAVLGLAYILSGITVVDWKVALIVAVVLGLLNNVLRPILIVLTIPATVLSLGLFLFVINACMVLISDHLIDGFSVDNFWWALLFSLFLSITQSILYSVFGVNKAEKKER